MHTSTSWIQIRGVGFADGQEQPLGQERMTSEVVVLARTKIHTIADASMLVSLHF